MTVASDTTFDATVVICTKNRKDELRRAVKSATSQTGCRVEVLVIDDGSTDGTSEMMRGEFPSVRLERSEQSLGLIVQRNRGAGLAKAPIIVSIDDDAIFSTSSVVDRTLKDFDHPLIGVVAIPFVNVLQSETVLQKAPDPLHRSIVGNYIGTAYALKRELFVGLGGYREHLFHQCEEEDFCIRLLETGHFIRLGNADPIHHFESPRRDNRRIFVYHARNHLLFGWHNVPMPFYPLYILATTLNIVRNAIVRHKIAWTLEGLWRGWIDTFRFWGERRPVSGRTYLFSRKLKRSPGILTPDADMTFDATIVICSKNRKDELRRAVESAVLQTGCAIEVIVIDDGSTDGTADTIKAEFPTVRVERSEQSQGYIVQRNRGARLAKAPVIISIDDDAIFSTPSVVWRTLQDFDHPLIAAVAVPCVNVLQGEMVLGRSPDPQQRTITYSYIGTAHALKTDTFIKLGGYREHLVHQCEEDDFCIRLLDAGHFVRLGNADPIHHFESPKRDNRRIFVYHARNQLLFGWHNVPMPYFPIYIMATTVNVVRNAIVRHKIAWTLEGLWRGWIDTFRFWRERQPVSGRTYIFSRRLRRSRGMLMLEK